MMALLKHMRKPHHDEVVSAVTELLQSHDWQVEKEPIVGRVRPDLVAVEPHGKTYVFEIKEGDGGAGLGAVAQVETFKNAVSEQSGKSAEGFLVVLGEIPAGLTEIADRAGVGVMRAESADAAALRHSLVASGVLSELSS